MSFHLPPLAFIAFIASSHALVAADSDILHGRPKIIARIPSAGRAAWMLAVISRTGDGRRRGARRPVGGMGPGTLQMSASIRGDPGLPWGWRLPDARASNDPFWTYARQPVWPFARRLLPAHADIPFVPGQAPVTISRHLIGVAAPGLAWKSAFDGAGPQFGEEWTVARSKWGPVRGWSKTYALMTAIRDAGRVYSFAGLETSGRIDLGGCAAGA